MSNNLINQYQTVIKVIGDIRQQNTSKHEHGNRP
jgi:hypothetical protein